MTLKHILGLILRNVHCAQIVIIIFTSVSLERYVIKYVNRFKLYLVCNKCIYSCHSNYLKSVSWSPKAAFVSISFLYPIYTIAYISIICVGHCPPFNSETSALFYSAPCLQRRSARVMWSLMSWLVSFAFPSLHAKCKQSLRFCVWIHASLHW